LASPWGCFSGRGAVLGIILLIVWVITTSNMVRGD
jgi:hypothetical protein